MLGWFGDLGRLSWGLLYWNWRKSLFRFRGASGPAPCQHPSDSGAPGKAACEACNGWRRKDRFRVLCPLLARDAAGRWVCSVGAPQVRPFWGRAALCYASFLGAAALVAVLSVFTVFQSIGYRVPLYVVAWPPAWHRVRQARADYFFRMAERTMQAGDMRRSYLALNQVYALDPDNAPAGMLLAQFTQLGSPDFSDAIYARLLKMDLRNHEQIAQYWFRALIARGDMAGVVDLAASMLLEGTKQDPAWTEALVFAANATGDTSAVDRILAAPAGVPLEARSVLQMARATQSGGDDERLRVLTLYVGGASTPYEMRYSLGRLIRLGGAKDVAALLEASTIGPLSAYDREALKLDAYAALGWHALERREIDYLFEQGTTTPLVVLISGHLVRYPDPETAAHVFGRLSSGPLAPTEANFPGYLSLLCAAAVNGLPDAVKAEEEAVTAITGGDFPAGPRVHEFFDNPSRTKSPSVFLPFLPQLPLEMVYALYEHYGAVAAAAAPH